MYLLFFFFYIIYTYIFYFITYYVVVFFSIADILHRHVYNNILIIPTGNRTSDIAYYLRYSGDPGNQGPVYNMPNVVDSLAGSRLSKINCLLSKEDCMDTLTAYDLFYNVRSRATTDKKICPERVSSPDPNASDYECFDSHCLFDMRQDPCEFKNVAKQNQQAYNMTMDMLEQFKSEMIMQDYPKADPDSDPRHFGGYWDTWMEPSASSESSRAHMCILVLTGVLYFLTN